MKGYFGIGVQGATKAMNVGALFRTAHAFGAGFVFTVGTAHRAHETGRADTSATPDSVPTYHFADVAALRLPVGCRLVGIEIADDAIALPSFRHPRLAAYVLGAEREGLSAELQGLCDWVVRIPTAFSINLAVAGALVMYDRSISLGRHAPRPVAAGAPTEPPPALVWGEPMYRRRARHRAARAGKERAP